MDQASDKPVLDCIFDSSILTAHEIDIYIKGCFHGTNHNLLENSQNNNYLKPLSKRSFCKIRQFHGNFKKTNFILFKYPFMA